MAVWSNRCSVLGVVWLTLCLAGCAGGLSQAVRADESLPARFEPLAKQLEEAVNEHELTSLSLAVVDAEGTLFQQSLGYADVEHGVPASPYTPYRWGSNSKLFVMLAVLQLAEAGKLELDAPLVRYVPEFSIRPPPPDIPEARGWQLSDITVRSLLTHQSGLPSDLIAGFYSRRPPTFQALLPQLAELHAVRPVGLVSSYSNVAFTLLGIVIERVSGATFNDYMRRQLFYPAGMQAASFEWNDYLERHVARSYDAKQRPVERHRLSAKPAGALMASTDQMARFASAILRGGLGEQGRLIGEKQLAASFEVQNSEIALDFDQERGLAWFIGELPNQYFGFNVAHGGGLKHHHSAFFLLPEAKLGVLAVSNCQRGAGVVARVAVRALEQVLRTQTGQDPLPEPPDPPPASASDVTGWQAEWQGRYATPFGAVDLVRDDAGLGTELGGRRLSVRPLVDGTLGVWTELWGLFDVRPDELERLRFSMLEVGERRVVVQFDRWGKRRLIAVKLGSRPAPRAWRDRVGVYHYQAATDELPVLGGVRLFLAGDGQLMAQPLPWEPGPGSEAAQALRPLADGAMVSEGLGRNHGLRLEVDEQGRLHMGGGIFVPE